jgi:PAS domain S-box-containing protein
VAGWLNLIHPDDRDMMDRYLNIDVAQQRKPFNKEYRIIREVDKEVRWVSGQGEVSFDEKGNLLTMIGTIQDVNDRKRMEEKIVESEAYYRTLIEISPDGIITADLEGFVNYASRKALEIFGISSIEKVLGTSILSWVKPEYHLIVMERVTKILEGNLNPETVAYQLYRSDKSSFWGELSSSPLTDKNGNPIGLLIVCRDISERKKAEEDLIRARDKAEESDNLKTAFLHNISHEIRTPMNAIIGFSALLKEPNLDTHNQHSYIDIINQSCDHLLGVVSDIIEISNIETGSILINKKEINLNKTLKNLVAGYNKDSENNIRIKCETGLPEDFATIMTDSDKLIKILSNLLKNAVKFTDKGEVEVGYTLKDEQLEFYVSDTGIGISPEQHSKIFERFYQVESTIARKYEGTGLGLPISKAYVELLGGKIWLKSEPGKGSVFYFTLPYIHTGATDISGSNGLFLKREKSNGDKTILIAEDEENNYMLLVKLLSSAKIKLLHAKNGKEAVDFCESVKDIDLILMDIKMPVMDGYSATQEIRKIYPDLPVIALTAYAFEADREKAISCGCNEYLSKPVKKELLLETVYKYL